MNKNRVLFGFIRTGLSIIIILIILYLAIGVSKTAYDFGYRVFTEPAVEAAPGTDILIQVKEDMSEKNVAQLLKERGLVRDANLFYIQLKLSVYEGNLTPGIYTLNTSMTPKEIMAIIAPEQEASTESTQKTETTVINTEASQETTEDSSEVSTQETVEGGEE